MTSTGALSFTTTHGMINRIHRNSPDMWSFSKPTFSSGFSKFFALMFPVSNLAYARPAKFVEFPYFSGGQPYEHIVSL